MTLPDFLGYTVILIAVAFAVGWVGTYVTDWLRELARWWDLR